jgi:hypothetical protein
MFSAVSSCGDSALGLSFKTYKISLESGDSRLKRGHFCSVYRAYRQEGNRNLLLPQLPQIIELYYDSLKEKKL